MPEFYGSGYWGTSNNSIISNVFIPNQTSGTNMAYPTAYSYTVLPGVLESPSAEKTDREWLDAQIDEVCALA